MLTETVKKKDLFFPLCLLNWEVINLDFWELSFLGRRREGTIEFHSGCLRMKPVPKKPDPRGGALQSEEITWAPWSIHAWNHSLNLKKKKKKPLLNEPVNPFLKASSVTSKCKIPHWNSFFFFLRYKPHNIKYSILNTSKYTSYWVLVYSQCRIHRYYLIPLSPTTHLLKKNLTH